MTKNIIIEYSANIMILLGTIMLVFTVYIVDKKKDKRLIQLLSVILILLGLILKET